MVEEHHGSFTPDESRVEHKEHIYIPVRLKFALSITFASLWFLFSLWISRAWAQSLGEAVGTVAAWVIILFIALIPGFLVAHLLMSILLDRPPPLNLDIDFPAITILIAAYNEEDNVAETFRSIRGQDYPSPIEIIVVDDGSTDGTVAALEALDMPNLKVIKPEHGGKSHALNEGIKHVTNGLVVTIDADTFLHPQALRRIIARLVTDPPGTMAVAGSVLVKNSRKSMMTRMQEWDYFAAISSVKRQQGLYQGALVAQGAFSVFHIGYLRTSKGWPDVIGEDIVMTWSILKAGFRVGYEPTAVGFTVTPVDLKGFFHQRKRWARGMIEGFKYHGDIVWTQPHLPAYFVAVDFLFPLLDMFFTFAYIPGIILALTGRFYIVGPLSVLVLPLAIAVVLVMYYRERKVFDELGLKVRRNRFAAVVYVLGYQFIMSPICVVGYAQELLGLAKTW
jgi:poly-beta-1,6-N-acetyl-D-glucosamine synthase